MTKLEKELLDEVYRDMEYYNNDFSLDKLPHIEAQKKVYNFLESIVDHFGTSDYDFVFAITKLEERHGKFLLPYLFEVLDNYINYPDAFRQDVAYAAYQNISLHYRRYFLINEMIVFLKGPYIEAFYEDFPYALNVLGDYALMENMHDKMLLINQAMLRNVESFKEKKPSYF